MRSLKHRVRIARRLSWRDWLVLGEAWGRLLYYSLALRRTSFERLESSIHITPKVVIGPTCGLDLARRLQRLVGYASQLHLLPMTCLVRTLALQWMLGKRGTPSQVRIGASRSETGMNAHAWLEVGGQTVGEPEEVSERFKVLSSAG